MYGGAGDGDKDHSTNHEIKYILSGSMFSMDELMFIRHRYIFIENIAYFCC
jgi:hypothetical protein